MAPATNDLRDPERYRDRIREAVDVLDGGGLVVFPTETVYGIGARADRPDAVERLGEAKQRDPEEAFTVHLARRRDVERYVDDPGRIAKRFIKKGWPGPLTLLLTTEDPSKTAIAGQVDRAVIGAIYQGGTIGLRCPDDPMAADLLGQVEGPVIAASANRAGHRPPGTAQEAVSELNGYIDLALDGGPTRYNRSSTIVRIDGDQWELVREGVLDERMLRGFAGVNVLFVCTGSTCRSPMALGIAQHLIASQRGCSPAELADRDIHFFSAGASGLPGARASPHAVDVLSQRGIDISSHTSQALRIELIHQADYIFTMTATHKAAVLAMVPSAEDRTWTLSADQDIADPIGGDRGVYAACADTIEQALKVRLKEVEL